MLHSRNLVRNVSAAKVNKVLNSAGAAIFAKLSAPLSGSQTLKLNFYFGEHRCPKSKQTGPHPTERSERKF